MDKARATVLGEIDTQDLVGVAGRHFAEVVHVCIRPNGFVQGTARIGRNQIRFDSYSFQEAAAGLNLGPFNLPGYDPATGAPLQKNSAGTQGRSRNTMLYGTVVQPEPGKYRFLDAVVGNEFYFFWSTLKYGGSFVHTNKFKYYRQDAQGKKTDGTLYAAACLLVGDAHTLMHDCLPEEKRPPKHTGLGLAIDKVPFVLLLAMLARSSEPYRLFATVLRSRKKTVEPEYLAQLTFMDPCTAQQATALVANDCSIDVSALENRLCPITPAVVRFVVLQQQEQVMQQLHRTVDEDDDDDDEEESSGMLSDDEEIERKAEKMVGAFQESEGSDLSDDESL